METKQFIEFVLALRKTFAATHGRVPTEYLDAFVRKVWPQMELMETAEGCVLCEMGDGDHIHTEFDGKRDIFFTNPPSEL